MWKTHLKGYILVSVLLLGMVSRLAGSIITVDVNGFADYENIQEAIDNASNGDVVVVDPGTYTGEGNRDIDFLGKAITVRSTDPNDANIVSATVIDCNGTPAEPHRGFYFHDNEDGNSVLNGFTITNGYARLRNGGGAIYCYDSSPTIANCLFSDNSAEVHGGGVSNWESSPTITKCTFSGNSALYGGGMRNWDNSSPVVTNCTFKGNSAWLHSGGGMYNRSSSSPKLTNCTFSGNAAWWSGGGMRNSWGSKPELTNCIFSGNSSVHDGGGMYNGSSSRPTLTNCTFSGNTAYENGGGICNYDSAPSIANCILWGNTDESGCGESAQIYDLSNTSITNYCCVQGWTGQLGGIGNIDVAPCFVEPGKWVDANDPNIVVEPNDPNAMWVNGDYRLLSDSPCVDAGDNDSVPEDTTDLDGDGNTTEAIPWDLDGNSRIMDGNSDGNSVVDMGAYEFFNMSPVAGPHPPDCSDKQCVDVTPCWTGGEGMGSHPGDRHYAYFSTNYDDVNNAGIGDPEYCGSKPADLECFDPDVDCGVALELWTHYYWRIDEKPFGRATVKGSVWHFMTGCREMPGDINLDCEVDGRDFAMLADDWMTTSLFPDDF